MKKLFIISLLLFGCTVLSKVEASYKSYQEITVKHGGMTMLEDYLAEDFTEYYGRLGGRKFFGWQTFTKYKNEPVYFVKETLYLIENEGTSPIKERIKFTTENTITKQLGVSGSIGVSGDGKVKQFKLGLEAEIDGDYQVSEKEISKEEYQIEMEVDPMTRLTIKVLGEAKVTNGVAKYYAFWFETKKGGWEIFIVTTEYYSLKKEFM